MTNDFPDQVPSIYSCVRQRSSCQSDALLFDWSEVLLKRKAFQTFTSLRKSRLDVLLSPFSLPRGHKDIYQYTIALMSIHIIHDRRTKNWQICQITSAWTGWTQKERTFATSCLVDINRWTKMSQFIPNLSKSMVLNQWPNFKQIHLKSPYLVVFFPLPIHDPHKNGNICFPPPPESPMYVFPWKMGGGNKTRQQIQQPCGLGVLYLRRQNYLHVMLDTGREFVGSAPWTSDISTVQQFGGTLAVGRGCQTSELFHRCFYEQLRLPILK